MGDGNCRKRSRLQILVFFPYPALSLVNKTISWTRGKTQNEISKIQPQPTASISSASPQLSVFQVQRGLGTILSHPSFWLLFPIWAWNVHTCSPSPHFQSSSSRLKSPFRHPARGHCPESYMHYMNAAHGGVHQTQRLNECAVVFALEGGFSTPPRCHEIAF